jgi:hypothetical protein
MSSTATGLEGMLASRILAGAAERQHDIRDTLTAAIEASASAFETSAAALQAEIEQAKRVATRRVGKIILGHPPTVTVTSTTKDAGTSIQALSAGSLATSAAMVARAALVDSNLDLFANAMVGAAVPVAVIRYLGALQTFAQSSEWTTSHYAATSAMAELYLPVQDRKRVESLWLSEVCEELAEVLQEAPTLNDETREVLSGFAHKVLDVAVGLGTIEPAIDTDHQTNLHLFWKEGSEGLLVVLRPDRTIHFFGSSNGESFRSDYSLKGKTWLSHLQFYLQPFRSNASSK